MTQYSFPVLSITETNITLLYPDLSPAEVYSVRRDDPVKAGPLLDIIKSKDAQALHNFVASKLALRTAVTQALPDGWSFHPDNSDVLTWLGKEVDDAVKKRVLDAHSLGLPLTSFEMFLNNLDQNPSFNSRKQLMGFLSACDLPITDSGYLLAYKAVRDDFFDKHSGTVKYAIGSVVSMDRSAVDDNPNNTCSHGLHVCSKEYGRFAKRLLIVYVNPADVVSVPTDYNNAKMRVCKLTVGEEVKDFKSFEGEPIYSNHYDEPDYDYDYDDWDELCEEAGDSFYDNDWTSDEDEVFPCTWGSEADSSDE